jgi:hypothetical protein
MDVIEARVTTALGFDSEPTSPIDQAVSSRFRFKSRCHA